MPVAVDRVAVVAGRLRDDQTVRLWSLHFKEQVTFSLKELPAAFRQQRKLLPPWARYILSVINELMRAEIALAGFDAVVGGDVPLGGGMSSSASLTVATAQFGLLASQDARRLMEMSPLHIAALCQRAEQRAVGVECGILDQAASCLGQPGKAIVLDCQSLEYCYVPFALPDVSLVIIDTGVRRALASSSYNERRQQCQEAVRRIREAMEHHEPGQTRGRDSLRDITPEQFERYQHVLSPLLRRRVRYVLAENARVLMAAKLLKQGKIEAMGALLWKSHVGLRDEYDVSCAELDLLVEIAGQVPGVLGARMLGGGFGGCTVNLVRKEAIEVLREAVQEHYTTRTALQATLASCRSAGGPEHTQLT